MFEWLPTVRMKKIKRAENIMEMGNGRAERERERERERECRGERVKIER